MAQRFRARTERSGKKKAKRPPRPRRDIPVDTAQAGVSATARRAGRGSTAARNRSKSAARKAGAALEDSQRDRPSRKSTRASANRAKRDSNLARRAVRRTTSPKARARRTIAASR